MEETDDCVAEVNESLQENWHENIHVLEKIIMEEWTHTLDLDTAESLSHILEYMKDNKETILEWDGFPPQTLDNSIINIILWAYNTRKSSLNLTLDEHLHDTDSGCNFCNLE